MRENVFDLSGQFPPIRLEGRVLLD